MQRQFLVTLEAEHLDGDAEDLREIIADGLGFPDWLKIEVTMLTEMKKE